jgi:ligand-binding SRPBCC domain-containing protein
MTAPAKTKQVEFRSVIPTTLESIWAFHAAPNAFSKLTPPPIFIQVHRRDLKSLTEGEIEFTLWFGPLPARWTARHTPGPIPTSFVDEAVSGPVAYWRHEHIFTPVPGGVELLDRLTIGHKNGGFWSVFTRLFFDGLPLRFLFFYRHLRTRFGVKRVPKEQLA